MPIVGRYRSRPTLAALIGIVVAGCVNLVIIIVDPKITKAVPLLVLLVPVMLSSVLGGWRGSVPVAVVTGAVYALAYVAPVGVIRLGLTEDTLSITTFLIVALIVGALVDLGQTRQSDRDRQRAVMLRSVSHDLRNPLGAMRAASADLRDDIVKDPVMRAQLLAMLADESERLDRIVGNLLSMSRIEAGALRPAKFPESIREVIETSVRRLQRNEGNRRITIDVPEAVDVDVDRVQIDQVITNLVENALRHAPGAPVLVQAVERNGMVEVTISDRGPGLSQSARAHAFEFFRPDGETGSAGVGLGVCKAIVEAHGGTIRIADQDDKTGGTRITFTVPKA